MGLRELGQLEQDLVFGDAGAKEVINFLRKNQVISYWHLCYWSVYDINLFFTLQEERSMNKLRLMMIYATVYPEKFEGDKALKLMQVYKFLPTPVCTYCCVYSFLA